MLPVRVEKVQDSAVTLIRPEYVSPRIFDLGSLVDRTGHCSSGCEHDAVLHPEEFKYPVS